MHIIFIAITSIIFSVAAQFLLKIGMSSFEIKQALTQPLTVRLPWIVLTNKFVFSGFVLYGLSAVVWLKVLSSWDVSKAYPLVGLGFGLTVLVGMILGESVSGLRVLGVILICEGVWLVANS
jgi:multidrug transporter EmrE-like cation transporter